MKTHIFLTIDFFGFSPEYVLLTKSDALFILVLKQQIFGLFPEYVLLKKVMHDLFLF